MIATQNAVGQTINHTERQTRLHSTDVAAILGLPGARRNEHTVWMEKTGKLDPEGGNKFTDAGQRCEPTILDLAEEELGPLVRNKLCVAPGLDFPLASTLDGQVLATGVPVEAKTSGIAGPIYGEWGDEGSDVIPQLYLVQCTIQMICSQSEMNHVYTLLGGRGFVRYQVYRDEQVVEAIVERCSRWWDRCIEKGIEPTITEPIPLEVLKRMRRRPASTIELDDSAAQVVAEHEAAKATKSAAEKTCAAAQSKVISLLADAEAGRLPDGRLVTYLQSTRKGYSIDETTFRTLRIKKG